MTWYLIANCLCFDANILHQTTQFCIFMQHISKLMQNFCISIQNDCWHKFYVSYCVSMQIFCIRGLKFVNIFKKFEILCKIFAAIFNHFVSKFKIIVGFMWSKKSKQCVKKNRFQVQTRLKTSFSPWARIGVYMCVGGEDLASSLSLKP